MWNDVDARTDETRDRSSDPRDGDSVDVRDVFSRDLDLPRGPQRERVAHRDREYDLRASEVRTLATIGAFRAVPVSDLQDHDGHRADLRHGDLERLRSAGLIQVAAHLDHEERTPVLTLTEQGRALLENHRSPGRGHARGARIHRVVLDSELKREYQRFLHARNEGRRDCDGHPDRTPDEVRDWAMDQHLPVNDNGVQFPDARIEYEWPDGRRDIEDIEVTTPHYRGAHAAAKARAGFTRYRAGRGRVGGRSGRGGGRSSDVRLAEEFLE
jgi:DNA-binding MarR family transcriptional regulator